VNHEGHFLRERRAAGTVLGFAQQGAKGTLQRERPPSKGNVGTMKVRGDHSRPPTVELSFATSLADAWSLASCGKLQSASLTGCRALPLDSVARLGRAQPRANIRG
jgi:hypothetical protein